MPTGGRHEHSDLAQGRFSTAVVEKLFTASRYLFAVKPWTFVKADQVLRMDIPTLGIDGACLSIIGQLGESRGVLIFPSLDGFERFLAAATPAAANMVRSRWAPDCSRSPSSTPPNCRHRCTARRCATHCRSKARTPTPWSLTETRTAFHNRSATVTSRTATACALALSAFLPKHAGIFQADSFTPVCESYFDDDDREVWFTVPYEAIADFKLNEPAEQERDASLYPRRRQKRSNRAWDATDPVPAAAATNTRSVICRPTKPSMTQPEAWPPRYPLCATGTGTTC